MKNLFFFCCVVISVAGFTQNLVPNPSFEEYEECPDYLGNLFALGWWSPTWASPDFFHSCTDGIVGVPQNAFGYQEPQEGQGYVGCHTSDFGLSEYREYVQCMLLQPLQENELYQVSYYVSRTDSSTKASDNLGCLLSQNEISFEGVDVLNFSPQVISPSEIPITADEEWIQIVDTIQAAGGEQYLTLGVFSNNENTTWIDVEGGWEDEAHYYFDNISVIALTDVQVEEHSSQDWRCFPNPANNSLFIESTFRLFTIQLFTLQGKLILEQSANGLKNVVDISQFPSGSYVIFLVNSSGRFSTIINIY